MEFRLIRNLLTCTVKQHIAFLPQLGELSCDLSSKIWSNRNFLFWLLRNFPTKKKNSYFTRFYLVSLLHNVCDLRVFFFLKKQHHRNVQCILIWSLFSAIYSRHKQNFLYRSIASCVLLAFFLARTSTWSHSSFYLVFNFSKFLLWSAVTPSNILCRLLFVNNSFPDESESETNVCMWSMNWDEWETG